MEIIPTVTAESAILNTGRKNRKSFPPIMGNQLGYVPPNKGK